LEAIKEQVKAKTMEEQAEKEGRPPLKRLERQILTETLRFEQVCWIAFSKKQFKSSFCQPLQLRSIKSLKHASRVFSALS
jgi:hypothetical protein